MWFKGPSDRGQQLVTRGKVSIQTIAGTTTISSLIITDVDVNDGGIYTCKAENLASTSEVTFTANISKYTQVYEILMFQELYMYFESYAIEVCTHIQ